MARPRPVPSTPLDVLMPLKHPENLFRIHPFEPFAVVANRKDVAIPPFFMPDPDATQSLATIFQGVIDKIPENPEKGEPVSFDLHFRFRFDIFDSTNTELCRKFVFKHPKKILDVGVF